jgi:F-type H+-transporting ATPase subunit delta
MAETITTARPYAKAIFEYALAANKLSQWSKILDTLALSILQEEIKQFLTNPAITDAQKVDLLLAPFTEVENEELQMIQNLLSLLARNKRLGSLPDVKVLFEELRAEQEKTLAVKVRSFSEFSPKQEEDLKNSLSQRLSRTVTLTVIIDKSLLGGAVIEAGDLVIDGSVREQLNRLGVELAA